MLSAEKKLEHLPLEHAWSPQVSKKFLLVRFWQLTVSKTQTNRDMSAQIKRVTRTLEEISDTSGFTLEMAKEALTNAKREFMKCAELAAEARDQALKEEAKALELAGKGEKVTILKI